MAQLESAILCAAHGWPVFPCWAKTKRPCTPHGFKDATIDEPAIESCWQRWPDANVAVATGAASGIVVVDVDMRDGRDGLVTLADLEREHGAMPRTVQSRTGGGGCHLFFDHPGQPVRNGNDVLGVGIDVKGDGGYVLVPRSIHESGKLYEWLPAAGPGDLPLAMLPAWMLPLVLRPTEDESTPVHPDTQTLKPCYGSGVLGEMLENAIATTLPSAPGQRNRCVFEFARALRAIPELAEADVQDLKPFVLEWHRRAVPFTSGTHGPTDTWADFVHAWPRVKYPKGQGRMAEAMAKAQHEQPPAAALDYEPNVQRLVLLCRQLQRDAGAKPFYLAGSAAGEMAGVGKRQALNYLEMFCADGILRRVRKGHTGRASLYEFVEDMGDESED